ncbi:hypothetical protein JRO89_XS10G0120100 [Xanthoceras sorbifolium]|uniref:Protein kinase domain-containing protein n=1 Tax=Xanthoceras sorbifolium TaxID=99658 RepID=A0ABQ8HID8_9ROSI|nr:hypothetical protein JRO89_XS10G0120100 [Xanthoceras sorbifolium]
MYIDRNGWSLSDSASLSVRNRSKTMSKVNKQEGIVGDIYILRPVPVPTTFVCGCCRCGWSIHSTSLLLIISSLYFQLTFCVASSSVPTTVVAATFGPTSTSFSNPPTPPLKPTGTTGHVDPKIVIPICVSALLVLLFVMAFFSKLFRSKKLRCRSSNNQVGVVMEQKNTKGVDDGCLVKKYSWDDIERFSKNLSQVVGSGGFSTVYLARLPASIQGAIKIHFGSERLHQVFKQELDILQRLRHDNVVKLLGYCDDREDQGALVFEYVPNGTLQEKLHESDSLLPWRNRMTIAFQLAQAIEYLHEKCTLQIVHGDIKASNILLDEYLNSKLCDFGSAKMGFSSIVMPSTSSPIPLTKQMMIGSPGYTDPHYLRTGIASKKNDLYGLGVIILELVTGMEAFCPERQRGQLLTSIAGPMLKSVAEGEAINVAEMVDPRLAGDLDLEEAKTMFSIAALCLGQSPILRPSATQILQTIKDQISSISFLPSPTLLPSCK